MQDKIDFVITWVDGNDPQWQIEKERYTGIQYNSDICRYRDWDLLRYWFRGVENFAPWINRIYFVTCGHKPIWLNDKHDKLMIVNHKDFIPIKYLPTFSSHTIELNIHRINGLSDKFVYFNDDVFLINKVRPDDFFLNGKPCDSAILTALQPSDDIITNIIFNNMKIINRYFKKNSLDFNRFISWKYGMYNVKSFFMLPFHKYSMFLDFHYSSNFLKSTFEKVWREEKILLDATCKHKFRNKDDVNQWLFRYWQLASNNFSKHYIIGKLYNIGDHNLASIIKKQKYKIICCNDVDENIDFEVQKNILKEAFENILPNKSKFEIS